eukprot:gene35216-biopygen27835
MKLQLKTPGSLELTMIGHSGQVSALCILLDKRIVSGSDDKTVRIWNASSGDCERILKGHSGQVSALCILPDGRIVSGSDDKTVRIWNASSGDCERILEGHLYQVSEVRTLCGGRFLSKDWGGKCLLWLPAEGGGGGFRSESVSEEEYVRLLWEEGVAFVEGRVLGRVAAGYSVSPQNCVQSGSFGRVFVDESVEWVVRAGDDVIAVFDASGRDHWLREVSDGWSSVEGEDDSSFIDKPADELVPLSDGPSEGPKTGLLAGIS